MDDQFIKEITIAAIENGMIDKCINSEETAIEIAKFIKELIKEYNK